LNAKVNSRGLCAAKIHLVENKGRMTETGTRFEADNLRKPIILSNFNSFSILFN